VIIGYLFGVQFHGSGWDRRKPYSCSDKEQVPNKKSTLRNLTLKGRQKVWTEQKGLKFFLRTQAIYKWRGNDQ
jgi:hypothetical protein